jgi:hypothetical protein
MTETQAAEAERLWAKHHVRQESLKTIYPFGFGNRELDQWMAQGHSEEETVTMFSERKGFCGCMYVPDISHLKR